MGSSSLPARNQLFLLKLPFPSARGARKASGRGKAGGSKATLGGLNTPRRHHKPGARSSPRLPGAAPRAGASLRADCLEAAWAQPAPLPPRSQQRRGQPRPRPPPGGSAPGLGPGDRRRRSLQPRRAAAAPGSGRRSRRRPGGIAAQVTGTCRALGSLRGRAAPGPLSPPPPPRACRLPAAHRPPRLSSGHRRPPGAAAHLRGP